METVVVKLGGGAITHKDQNERRVRVEVVRRAARELRRALDEQPARVVLVHGAGPFGHSLVAQHGIAGGVSTPAQVEGFVQTVASVRELDRQVAAILAEEGCLVVPLPPSACVIKRDHRVESLFLEPLERLLALDARLLPMLYGDMVVDHALGASVVSGDELCAEVARRLSARRVLLGTDVAGLFSADPKLDATAQQIPRVDRGNLEQVLAGASGATGVDVTAGMRGKLLSIARTLPGHEVLVFDLTAEDSLYRALTGRPVEGTWICL
jgi:isopentenyl phosphate kinase